MNTLPATNTEETIGFSADQQESYILFPKNFPFESLANAEDEVVTRTELPNELLVLTYKLGRIIIQNSTHLIVILPGRSFKLLRQYEPARILYRIIKKKHADAQNEYQQYLNQLSPAERYLKQLEVKAWILQQKHRS